MEHGFQPDSAWVHMQEAGWAIYIVVAFGVVGVSAAVRFAWRGEHQLLEFIRWILLAVFASGCFGFVVGMLNVFRYVVYVSESASRFVDLLTGTRESLNNIAGCLIFVVLMTVLTAVGHRRFPEPNPSSVPR